ncbi:MAG TPA: hypothetical protein VMO17_07210 [Terriglobia bacterium]|nr:hypothetical protein [Terriglobia bacterium]
MTRLAFRSRRVFVASIPLLLTGIVVFSAATRRPCFHTGSVSWHLCKSGHMTRPKGQESCKRRVTAEAKQPHTERQQARPPRHFAYLPNQDPLPPVLSHFDQTRHLRAPPDLG